MRYNEALKLLHVKSGEIETLTANLAASERKRFEQDEIIANLKAEKAGLQRAQMDKEELAAINGPGVTNGADEKEEILAAVTKEKEALAAELTLVQASKKATLDQLELFKENYFKASEFTDELRKEVEEYKERATLAENQVKLGVELVRRAARTTEEKLRTELERVKAVSHILTTRDNRTDEEVRRKAALEPELRGRIVELREELDEERATVARLVHQRDDLLVGRREMEDELRAARTENMKMKAELEGLQVEIARCGARERIVKSVLGEQSKRDFESDAMVYVCEWTVDGERCNALFDNVRVCISPR